MKLKTEHLWRNLIKGIPHDFPISEIKPKLKELGNNIHSICILRSFETKLPMPILLVDVFHSNLFKHIF